MPRRFANWARNVVTKPTSWLAPTSEEQIVDAIRGAQGQRLRVVGGGHSWSAIAAPEQIGMTLDGYAGVLARDDRTVTLRAGTRLKDLNAALAADGFALPIVGSIAEQSLAGAIATGTHGSSLVHGNLATLVERMKLVDGRGNVQELTGERLDAARVHLGALGVVTELTLRTLPAFRLAETVEGVRIGEVTAQLETIAKSAEYVKVWWMPHTPFAHVFRYERTDEPATAKPDLVRARWIEERVMHGWLFPGVLRVCLLPGLQPAVGKWIAKGFMKPRRVGVSTLMLSTPMPVRHRETEAALPMAKAGEAVERIVRAIDREKLIVNFILEIRFVRGDQGWMSPAYGADTCQIGAYCWGPRSTRYFAAFWREMRELGARPHWGKELDHTADEVRALWPRTKDFVALRDELDPDRVFASEFHTRILGA